MKVSRLLNILRLELDDNASNEANRLWSDPELASYADEAATKFCKDTRILRDSATVGEVVAAATIVLTGTSGQVSSVSVSGVLVTSGPVQFNADLPTTANDLAANINAFSLLYVASAAAGDGTVAVSALPGTGANSNGYAVVTTCSGGDMAIAPTVLSGGTSLCRLYLMPGVTDYAVDPRIIQIERMKSLTARHELKKTAQDWMDEFIPGWDGLNVHPGHPRAYIPDISPNSVTIFPPPLLADTLKVTVIRRLMESMLDVDGSVNMDYDIELDDSYIYGIRCWTKRCACMKADIATYIAEGAKGYEADYEKFVNKVKAEILLRNSYGAISTPNAGNL